VLRGREEQPITKVFAKAWRPEVNRLQIATVLHPGWTEYYLAASC